MFWKCKSGRSKYTSGGNNYTKGAKKAILIDRIGFGYSKRSNSWNNRMGSTRTICHSAFGCSSTLLKKIPPEELILQEEITVNSTFAKLLKLDTMINQFQILADHLLNKHTSLSGHHNKRQHHQYLHHFPQS